MKNPIPPRNPLHLRRAPLLLAAGLAMLALLGGCGEARQRADCDQQMGNGNYDLVLLACEDPFFQASAYLGKAGLNLLDLLSQGGGATDVVSLLSLTSENINDKRGYLNLAIGAVSAPTTAGQAFALLISAFLGMGVTVEQYLDNGVGATALDNDVAQSEVDDFTGMTSQSANLLFASPPPPAPSYFQVVNNGLPYTLVCLDPADPQSCDDGTFVLTQVYDDRGPPLGAGMLDTVPGPSADQAAVFANLPGAGIGVNLVLQMVDLKLPFILDTEKTANMSAFLGLGDAEGEITIGIGGYLNHLQAANDSLADFSGSPDGIPEVAEAVANLRATLDNGAECLATLDPGGNDLFSQLYRIYVAAAGTADLPAPADGDYTTYNIVPDAAGFLGGAAPINAADFVFTEPIAIKWLFPLLADSAGTFNLANATPRVDQGGPVFQANFEQIPQLAPAAATAGDGEVSFIELFCVSSASDALAAEAAAEPPAP